VFRDRLGGPDDVSQVGVAVLAERSRDADQHGVALGEPVEVSGAANGRAWRGSRPDAERRGDAVGPDVTDVRLAAMQRVDLRRVDVEADHGKSRLVEHEGEGKADVAHTNDADRRGATLDSLKEILEHGVFVHDAGV
jgi:hypothetical protein